MRLTVHRIVAQHVLTALPPVIVIDDRTSGRSPEHQRGFGLGLYISKCIVDAHGGKLRDESESGQGSQCLVTVPATVAMAGGVR